MGAHKNGMKPLLLQLLALLARLFARRDPGPLRRILLIKPDHLGDLLLATPALAALRQSHPEASITALVGPWSRRMWQGNPSIDALIDLPFPGFERTPPGRRPSSIVHRLAALLHPYLLLLKYALLLRRGRYDAALLLRDDHWWGAALAALAGIPRRIGHAHPLCAPLLTTALPYNPHEHVTRQALGVVQALQDDRRPTTDDRRPTTDDRPSAIGYRLSAIGYHHPSSSFHPTSAEHAWADEWLAAQLGLGERLVVIHPGTGGSAKHWLPERWASVADALAATPGARLLLTGGPGEAPLVAEVAALMHGPAFTLAGQTSVGQLAALLGRAALVLGVDSGPLHLAVSQGAPSVHLFGPSDQARFGPWGDPQRHRVLRAGLFCSPCGVFDACPRGTSGPECMAAISVGEVVAVARQLLSS